VQGDALAAAVVPGALPYYASIDPALRGRVKVTSALQTGARAQPER